MNEFGPHKPEKKRRRRGKHNASEAASLGVLAAEGLVWERKKEVPEPILSQNHMFEALMTEKKKSRKPAIKTGETSTDEKPREADKKTDATTTETDDTTDDADTTTWVKAATVAEKNIEDDKTTTEKDHRPASDNAEVDSDNEEESDEQLTKLSGEEKDYVTGEFLKVRSLELSAEKAKAAPNSDEAAALNEDAKFLAKVSAKHQAEPEKPIEAAADEALSEVMAEMEISEPPKEPLPAEQKPEAAEPASPVAHEFEEPEPDSDAPGATPPVSGPPLGPVLGGTVPPMGPPPEIRAANSFNPPERAPGVINIAEEMIPYHESLYMERRAETRGLLVGGIVGYLVGRRRGRIRTEKRLKPIQEKLEKQVHELHDVIAMKERQIRTAAAEKARAARMPKVELVAPAVVAEVVTAAMHKSEHQPTAIPEQHNSPIEQVAATLLSPAEQPQHARTSETTPHQSPSPAPIFETLAAPVAAQLVAEREQPTSPRLHESGQPFGNTSLERATAEAPIGQIDSLSMPELLEVAAHVNIGKENLLVVYDNHRITEPGLRHILNEYVRGGNIKKVFKQELINKELTYERDPRMRKRLAVTLSGAGTAAGAVANVASKAKPKISKHSKRLAVASKNVGSKAIEKSRQLEAQDAQMRQFIIRIWMGVTIFLAIIAIILLLR